VLDPLSNKSSPKLRFTSTHTAASLITFEFVQIKNQDRDKYRLKTTRSQKMTIPEIPEFYQPKTTDVFVQDLTIYIGLVFDGVLDGELLEQKYREFVVRWPTVGGKLVTSVCLICNI